MMPKSGKGGGRNRSAKKAERYSCRSHQLAVKLKERRKAVPTMRRCSTKATAALGAMRFAQAYLMMATRNIVRRRQATVAATSS